MGDRRNPVSRRNRVSAKRLWSFVLLTRPLFLFGGALLYGLGAAIAASAGKPIDWGRYALGQAIVTAIQLMTHYSNEYFDLEPDRLVGTDRTWFSGGSGILPGGRLAPVVARRAAVVCAAVALIAIANAATVEPTMSAIGLLALLSSWFYSAPPVRLVASGFGELVTAMIIAFLAPVSGAVMQVGSLDTRLIGVALPLVLISIAMLLTFEFPDYDADRRMGKRTLAVRLGLPRASRLHNSLIALAFGSVWIEAAAGWIEPRIAAWTLAGLPLAAWQLGSMRWRARHGVFGNWLFTTGGVGLFALTALMFLVGFLTR
ncbi:MAG TPA: prenyltransferase [Anaerolineae bacterium]|nr:prenyltransferase [Anaerolineae bacterium]